MKQQTVDAFKEAAKGYGNVLIQTESCNLEQEKMARAFAKMHMAFHGCTRSFQYAYMFIDADPDNERELVNIELPSEGLYSSFEGVIVVDLRKSGRVLGSIKKMIVNHEKNTRFVFITEESFDDYETLNATYTISLKAADLEMKDVTEYLCNYYSGLKMKEIVIVRDIIKDVHFCGGFDSVDFVAQRVGTVTCNSLLNQLEQHLAKDAGPKSHVIGFRV